MLNWYWLAHAYCYTYDDSSTFTVARVVNLAQEMPCVWMETVLYGLHTKNLCLLYRLLRLINCCDWYIQGRVEQLSLPERDYASQLTHPHPWGSLRWQWQSDEHEVQICRHHISFRDGFCQQKGWSSWITSIAIYIQGHKHTIQGCAAKALSW